MDPRLGHNLRSWARPVCLGVSACALWLIFRRLDLEALMDALVHLKLAWFAGALLVFGLATLFAAIRWHLVLRLSQSAVHSGATFQMVIIGHFFNTLFLGPAGGDLGKSALYSRWYDYSASSILATCFLDRLLGGAGFLLLAALTPGLAALSSQPSHLGRIASSPPSLWILGGLLLALLLAGFAVHRRFKGAAPLRKLTQTFLSGASQLLISPRHALIALLASFLSQVCMSSLLLLCLQAVTKRPFSLTELIWTFPMISLISAAPVTFAGTGLREGAALVLFGLYGIAAADAVAASLLVLAVYLLWAVVSGLFLWWKVKAFEAVCAPAKPHSLSVVIPTFNEAAALAETVRRARQVPEISEIIVADGGSTDDTRTIARQLGCHVLNSPRGRGRQMRLGASQAKGDVIILLHADTWLPQEAGQAALNCLRDRSVVGGGFWKVFRKPSVLMAGSRFRCALRLYLGRRIAGDQAMFIRRAVLESIGGVPDMPLMEEFELCRRLRAAGALALAGATVTTSARRFAKLGVVRTYLRMWRVTLQYYLGTSAHQLEKLYERD